MAIHIKPEIEAIKETIISTRRDIHQNPELAFNEHRTAKLVAERLKSLGIDVQTGVGKTGVVGTMSSNNGLAGMGIILIYGELWIWYCSCGNHFISHIRFCFINKQIS